LSEKEKEHNKGRTVANIQDGPFLDQDLDNGCMPSQGSNVGGRLSI